MSNKKRGLGRGLDALLSGAATVETMVEAESADELKNIDVDLIHRGPWQPRVHFEEGALNELAESIKTQGVVQPIIVRAGANHQFEIVAGERRWRAAQIAGLQKIPAVIKRFDDQTAAAVSLIENIQRENLNPLEESNALVRLAEEFQLTHQQVADSVARSRAMVSNLIRLQELNPDVKSMLAEGKIEMGHARALLGVSGLLQTDLANEVARKGLSVRETEQLVKRNQQQPNQSSKASAAKDPDIISLENELSEKLGASVTITQSGKGKGKLDIKYNSLDELEGILSRIR